MNDFDISAGPRADPQPTPLGETSFMDGMNNIENQSAPRLVPLLPPLADVPFVDGMNDFDLAAGVCATPQTSFGNTFANTSSFAIPHQGVIDSRTFNCNMNDFDISAGQVDVMSRMRCARFQPPGDISQAQHTVGA